MQDEQSLLESIDSFEDELVLNLVEKSKFCESDAARNEERKKEEKGEMNIIVMKFEKENYFISIPLRMKEIQEIMSYIEEKIKISKQNQEWYYFSQEKEIHQMPFKEFDKIIFQAKILIVEKQNFLFRLPNNKLITYSSNFIKKVTDILLPKRTILIWKI